MTQGFGIRNLLASACVAAMAASVPALAQGMDEMMLEEAPEQLPETAPRPAASPAQPAPASSARPAAKPRSADPVTDIVRESEIVSQPVVQPLPGEQPDMADGPGMVDEPVMPWTLGDAQALLTLIENIGEEGLIPADYQPGELRAAIAMGEGDALDTAASLAFAWLIEDLRDGRTPVTARVQWFALDPDQDAMPTAEVMARALASHNVPGVLETLAPTHPDYAALKAELAVTPPEDAEKRALIQANMDRWRWLKRDLGKVYLITNVPEFQLRLVVNDRNIRTYRTIVGKPGRTATPQLAETVTAVVFNPTWTVPQSIVKGEGLGARVLGNPGWARANGYTATRGANGYVSVVQQPGPGNALGLMKIDLPNPHAIYFHDTPNKNLFDRDVRAFSHGCIRTERAVELGMTMGMLGAGLSPDEATEISTSREYTKVEMTRTFPAYITYFTYAQGIDGSLQRFADLYGRDAPVLESFAEPREAKTTQRVSDEPIIQLDNPL